MTRRGNWLTGMCACLLALAADAAEPPAQAKAAETASQQEARALLMQMANFLAKQGAFSVKVQAGFDVVQDDGQKIEFLESRTISLARPNRLRVEETAGDGNGILLVFDGSKMTVADGDLGVYAQADQPATVDDAVIYFIRELGMRLPLAPLITTRLPAEMEKRVKSIDFVESTDVLGRPAQHLAARTGTLDFQVWIADGADPLPLRIVMTYPDEGRPQYRALFTEWNLKPKFTDASFAFKAPADSHQVPFAVQIPTDYSAADADDRQAGGGKP